MGRMSDMEGENQGVPGLELSQNSYVEKAVAVCLTGHIKVEGWVIDPGGNIYRHRKAGPGHPPVETPQNNDLPGRFPHVHILLVVIVGTKNGTP